MSVRWSALLAGVSFVALTVPSLASASTVAPAAPTTDTVAPTVDTWGPIHRFERYPVGQSMVVDARGFTTVVWGSQARWPEPVKVARRTAAGRWLRTVALGVGYDPVVAADASGTLTVAWRRDRDGFTTGVWAARKPVGRPWTRPVHLSEDLVAPGYPDGDSAYGATDLDVAVHPGGAALVTWAWGGPERGIPLRVQAVYRPSQGRWGHMRALTPAAAAGNARVAFAPNGAAWVGYERSPETGPTRIKVRSRSVFGDWSPARRVGTGALGDLAVSRKGEVTLVFARGGRVRVASRPAAAGAWQEPFPVTPQDVQVRDWSVALSSTKSALVAYLWKRDRVEVVRRSAGGHWTSAWTVADPAVELAGVFTAINPHGDMFAGWHNNYGMWGRYRPAGTGWHATTTAQRDSGQVDVLEEIHSQVAPGGGVVLLWAQEERPLRARLLEVVR